MKLTSGDGGSRLIKLSTIPADRKFLVDVESESESEVCVKSEVNTLLLMLIWVPLGHRKSRWYGDPELEMVIYDPEHQRPSHSSSHLRDRAVRPGGLGSCLTIVEFEHKIIRT